MQISQQHKARDFHERHRGDEPLVLFNIWDVASARAVAGSCAAVATSSAAVAAALGYADGEQVPLDTLVALVALITEAVPLPVTVDLEACYGDTPHEAAAAASRMIAAGAVGINLEDGLHAGKRELVPATQHAAKIAAIRDAARAAGVNLFINARTDPFLLRSGLPPECADEAARRAAIYREAGADGIFVPGLTDLTLIARLAGEVAMPLNVMITTPTVAPAALARAGVARISLGPWPLMAFMRSLTETAARLTRGGAFGGPLEDSA